MFRWDPGINQFDRVGLVHDRPSINTIEVATKVLEVNPWMQGWVYERPGRTQLVMRGGVTKEY